MLAQFNRVPLGIPICDATKNRLAMNPRTQHNGLGDLLNSSAGP